MNSERLRQAAEKAGCHVKDSTLVRGWWFVKVRECLLYQNNPALPAYVASLLVAKARMQYDVTPNRGLVSLDGFFTKWRLEAWCLDDDGVGRQMRRFDGDDLSVLLVASSMVALEHWTMEEAREAIEEEKNYTPDA